MADDWSRKLTQTLRTKDGGALATLSDARGYVLGMDTVRQNKEVWRIAVRLMLSAAAGGSVAAATNQIERALSLDAKLWR